MARTANKGGAVERMDAFMRDVGNWGQNWNQTDSVATPSTGQTEKSSEKVGADARA